MFKSFINRNTNPLIKEVMNICSNQQCTTKLKQFNLNASTVAWEDTSRFKGSCVGDNISDMTLNVDGNRMPIIRSPNFADVTCDLAIDNVPKIPVGNQNGTELKMVTLKEYLTDLTTYIDHDKAVNLFHDRDTHVLTSAQGCILPLKDNNVEFCVDLYNYQSYREPAVLVIIATAHGTSAQVVCGGNTQLYFNNNTDAHLFKAERLTDYRIRTGKPVDGPMTSEEKALNGIYIFQVPLKYTKPIYNDYAVAAACATSFSLESSNGMVEESCVLQTQSASVKKSLNTEESDEGCCSDPFCTGNCRSNKGVKRGMERAILGIGKKVNKYVGTKNYNLERDVTKPIRLTVQFYMATDSMNLNDANINEMATQIKDIYNNGVNTGSLVTNASYIPGEKVIDVSSTRPTVTTEPIVPKPVTEFGMF